MDKVGITLDVNGAAFRVEVEPRRTLADVLRDDCGLTGTHLGCEHGVCGACTILLDGLSARSCLMLAVQADGHEILTVEGIAPSADKLHPLQEAFRDNHGLQCGFCTPGILTTLIEFLRDNPDPSEREVRIALSGNLCRCTGYTKIYEAVEIAAQMKRGDAQPEERRPRPTREDVVAVPATAHPPQPNPVPPGRPAPRVPLEPVTEE